MLSRFWKSYLVACEATYRDLDTYLKYICYAAIALHGFYFVLNKIIDGTEVVFLRAVVIVLLLPSLVAHKLPKHWLPFILVSALIVSGPLFMLAVVSLEWVKPDIQLENLIILEYEYFATLALCFVVFSQPKTIAIVNLVCFVIAASWVITRTNLSHELLPLAVIPLFSIWLPAICAGIFFFEKKSILLERKAEALCAVGSSIAHELRTPIAGIQNFAVNMEKILSTDSNLDLSRQRVRGKRNILQEARIPAKIIDLSQQANTIIDMLLISSKDRKEHTTVFGEFSAERIIRSSIESYPYCNDHELNLVHFDPDSDFTIRGPQLELIHVILNLMKNAIRFSQRNRSRQVEISVDAITRTISVIDDGPGISPQAKRRIFDRFYTTEKYGQGTGIGLSFCKMTMESIGGSIECESVLGEYTKFTLKFP